MFSICNVFLSFLTINALNNLLVYPVEFVYLVIYYKPYLSSNKHTLIVTKRKVYSVKQLLQSVATVC